ncbi:hypothetical protein [Halomarina litorea]|uniref:hypothetical protein n=1 Tax=Halomarina litorea TaxID=2961595 RepID=UPI0020C57139|nr:hypothetical protein [Halomarina sp. BCD28]
MTEGTETPVSGAEDAAAERDEVVARMTEHAGEMARELALLDGGDYGQRSFSTDRGKWTLKYEAGAVQYLRFEGKSGGETYVVSTHRPPDPEALARARADYDAFVEAFNDYVESLDGLFDDAADEFPEVASAESVVAERDRIAGRMREAADAMAGELHRFGGDEYGTYATRVGGTRWELKWERDRASYLRVGGEGGVYLLSQYGPASAPDVRALADDFAGFVDAFNAHVDALDADLSRVTLD